MSDTDDNEQCPRDVQAKPQPRPDVDSVLSDFREGESRTTKRILDD